MDICRISRAGAAIPPYDYTGFVATIEFIDNAVTLPTSTAAAFEVTPPYPSMAVQSKKYIYIILAIKKFILILLYNVYIVSVGRNVLVLLC